MTLVRTMAGFVARSSYSHLSTVARKEIKARVLDSLGCAVGALAAPPIRMIRSQVAEFGRTGPSTLIGGGRAAPDRASLFNGALIRYLDFSDSYLAKGETCHPSDSIGPILACGEYAGAGGKDLMAAIAVAYQVQCRLSDEAPVRHKGFDHTTQGAYAVASGVSRVLGLSEDTTANAIAISGTALNALRVTRTGALSHWKGLAAPFMGSCAVQAAMLAKSGITGPPEVFEGNKGFMDSLSGPFTIRWEAEDLEKVTHTILKKYNAEIHSQSAIEGALDLKTRYQFSPGDIRAVTIEIFDVAYNIIGGGEEGGKTMVRTKEEADHSLPYMIAAALLDGRVTPDQYAPSRIARKDIQSLLGKIRVRPLAVYSRKFPGRMACQITIRLVGGDALTVEKHDYEGFHTRPMAWDMVVRKFLALCPPFMGDRLAREIVNAVTELDTITVRELMKILARVPRKG